METVPENGIVSSEQFQGIIKERREEWRKEKEEERQEGLKQIKDLNVKSRTGLHPLERFPKEIWLMIFDELDPEDKENIRKVHELFHDLLEDKLIGEILLPQTIGFEVEPFWITNTNASASKSLPLAQCLELRKVSKSLRNAIDLWFEDDLLHHLRRSTDTMSKPSQTLRLRLIRQKCMDTLRKMKHDLESPVDRKPKHFFIRSFSLLITPPTLVLSPVGRRNFRWIYEWVNTAINEILDYMGDQIWHFSCVLLDIGCYAKNGVSFAEFYTTLMGWLTRMPNLKWLRLAIDTGGGDVGNHPLHIPPDPTVPVPVPNLESLERIDFQVMTANEDDDPSHLLDAILSANPHVKILCLCGMNPLLNNPVLLGRIKNLQLETFQIQGFSYLPVGVNLFQAIESNNWMLSRMDLKLNALNASIFTYFRLLQNFQTLEELSLWIKNLLVGDSNDMRFTYLRLPNLSHFKIRCKAVEDLEWNEATRFFFSLQWLMFAKMLGKLEWNLKMTEDGHHRLQQEMRTYKPQNEIIKFCGGCENMSHSNIWSVFPWLEYVYIRHVKVLSEEEGRKQYCVKEFCSRELYSSSEIILVDDDNDDNFDIEDDDDD